MRVFEFSMALSAQRTQAIYEGEARYILVESDAGIKLQLPAVNFREHVSASGIQGRFRVSIDAANRILSLQKL